MKRIILILFLLLFSFFLASDSLNLVEIQKKEKERRKKLAKSKYVLTNDKLMEYSLKKSKTFVESDVVTTTDVEKSKTTKKKIDPKSTEQYWRNRLNILNKNIEGIKKNIQESQSALNRESSNFLIASTPSLQQQIKMNIDRLTKQISELRASLTKWEADKELFFREARREGALPGWLR
ncbi:MAG: hypothetical protein KAS21_11025 [Candidatus Aminicenantes bacterium]|nr:hypothetical protein [Candidatus Aminicenantes bacterium]